MNTEIQLVLVRHGESLWNLEGKYQGQQDSGLTALGREQANEAGQHLAARFTPTQLHASDSPRAVDTARPLADAWQMEIRTSPNLREIDVGHWSGRTFADVARGEGQVVKAFASGLDVPRGGGETLAAASERVTTALTDIANNLTFEFPSAIIFAHGGPIRLASAWVLGLEPTSMQGLESPGNCALTILTRSKGVWRLRGLPA